MLLIKFWGFDGAVICVLSFLLSVKLSDVLYIPFIIAYTTNPITQKPNPNLSNENIENIRSIILVINDFLSFFTPCAGAGAFWFNVASALSLHVSFIIQESCSFLFVGHLKSHMMS